MSKLINVISFSLYGNHPKYLDGQVANLRLIREFYPNWNAVVYCDWNVPETLREQMIALGAQIRVRDESWHSNGMFWRFYAAKDPSFTNVIFRDADSRIQDREMSAVTEWLNSGKALHIMRDHPNHLTPILGGMWGIVVKAGIEQLDFSKIQYFGDQVGADQEFLTKFVYPKFKEDALIHDEFFRFEKSAQRFPTPRQEGEYVGESFSEGGDYDISLRIKLLEVENSITRKILIRAKSRIQAKFSF